VISSKIIRLRSLSVYCVVKSCWIAQKSTKIAPKMHGENAHVDASYQCGAVTITIPTFWRRKFSLLMLKKLNRETSEKTFLIKKHWFLGHHTLLLRQKRCGRQLLVHGYALLCFSEQAQTSTNQGNFRTSRLHDSTTSRKHCGRARSFDPLLTSRLHDFTTSKDGKGRVTRTTDRKQFPISRVPAQMTTRACVDDNDVS
jgi:hypothetical protein